MADRQDVATMGTAHGTAAFGTTMPVLPTATSRPAVTATNASDSSTDPTAGY